MVVPEQRDETGAIEFAGHDAVLVCAVAKRKGYKIALEIVIAAHRAVGSHNKQLLVFGPAQAFDCALVPLLSVSCRLACGLGGMRGLRTVMLRISLPAQL